MKYYVVTTVYDSGTVDADVFTQEELEEKSWAVYPSARIPGSSTIHRAELPGYDLYIDEFDTEEEAQAFADEAMEA